MRFDCPAHRGANSALLMNADRLPTSPENARRVILLLAVMAAVTLVCRIAFVKSTTGETPMLSANDRSRWCTVRALVEHETFVIDSIIRERDPETDRRLWHTIDRVRHRGWDSREHDFSSKPPLLPTLVAAEYWVLRQVTGWNLHDRSFVLMRCLLLVNNGLLLIAFWWVIAQWLRLWCDSHFSQGVIFLVATFGTFLTTFAVTFNNHLPAAACCGLTFHALVRISQGNQSPKYFVLAGFAAALTAANELPALSLLAAVTAYLFWVNWKRFLVWFAPAVAVVAGSFFAANYVAHGSLRPAYAHRGEGKKIAELVWSADTEIPVGPMTSKLGSDLSLHGIDLGNETVVQTTGKPGRWAIWDPVTATRLALVKTDKHLLIHEWDDWYDYANSYWKPGNRKDFDLGEPSRMRYAFHVLIGHHGIFSLTPFWLLSGIGILFWIRNGTQTQKSFALLAMLLSLVCIVFFLMRPQGDRNYGGATTGFRWVFWMIPLWLGTAIPAVEHFSQSKTGRVFICLLVAVSMFSAAYGAMQPWSDPWLYDLQVSKLLGW